LTRVGRSHVARRQGAPGFVYAFHTPGQQGDTTFEQARLTQSLLARGEEPGIATMHEVQRIFDAVIEFADRLKEA